MTANQQSPSDGGADSPEAARPVGSQPQASDADIAPRILLVDDEGPVRQVVLDFLTDIGLAAVMAGSAAEALQQLERHPGIELMLSDIRMAGLSGIDLADQACRLRPGLRVVLMSGYFLPQPVDRRFLRKPFRLAELEAVLREELHL